MRKPKPQSEMLTKGILTPPEYRENRYLSLLLPSTASDNRRVMLGIPMYQNIRPEWAAARYGQIIPTNWSISETIQWLNQISPFRYSVADARNVICHIAMAKDFEWILFNDSDTIMPLDCFFRMNAYIKEGSIPIVAGLYTTKSDPPEPLIYRGAGLSYYSKFKLGDKVWADGAGFGCTLVNVGLLKAMAQDAPLYTPTGWPYPPISRLIDTPQFVWCDPETGSVSTYQGTEDLAFFRRAKEGGYYAKAGFPKIQKRKHSILVDSGIFCMHIDPNGVKYPLRFEW